MNLDEHLQLVKKRGSLASARKVLETLEGIPFVVVGGWACYAHGSPVPSVDLDIWIDLDDHDAVYERFLERHGVQLDAAGVKDGLNLDIEYLESLNPFYRSEDQYLRGDLDHESRDLLGHQVNVLVGTDLLFAKAKAFHDRSRQWRDVQDPVSMAVLRIEDPGMAQFMDARGESYWLRKAGKDLLDVRFLQTKYEMGGPEHLQPLVEAPLVDPPAPLVAWGRP